MTEPRILCRVVTYDKDTDSVLLVRNQGQNWWCAPGGGWDHNNETILECALREVREETGVCVRILKLLYVQTLYVQEQKCTWLELFWLAEPVGAKNPPVGHVDQFGVVDEVRWFNRSDSGLTKILPKVLTESFWRIVQEVTKENNRYIGHFTI